jgi:hypothetical protein
MGLSQEDFNNLVLDPNTVSFWIDTETVSGSWVVSGLSVTTTYNDRDVSAQLKQVQVVNFKLPGEDTYYSFKVRSRVKGIAHYTLYPENTITIPVDSIDLNGPSSEDISLIFEPNLEDLFNNSYYEAVNNNSTENRKSNYYLKVEKSKTQVNPLNLEFIITGSDANNRNELPKNAFAEIQDSMYNNSGWSKGRYDGSEYTVTTQGGFRLTPTLVDPFFGLYTFTGSIYSPETTTGSIYSSQDSERTKTIIKYRNRPRTNPVGNPTIAIQVVSTNIQPKITCTSSGLFGQPQVVECQDNPVETTIQIVHSINGTVTGSLAEINVTLEIVTNEGILFPNITSTSTVNLTIPLGSSTSSPYTYKTSEVTCSGEFFPCYLIVRMAYIKSVESEIPVIVDDIDVQANFQRKAILEEDIIINRTYLYEEIKGNIKFIPISTKKVYSLETKQIYETDKDGMIKRIYTGDLIDEIFFTPSPTPTPT